MSKNNNKNYQNQNNNQKPTLTEEQLKAKMAFAENMVPKEANEAKPEEVAPVEGTVETAEAKTEEVTPVEGTQPVEEAPVNEEVKVEAPAEEVPSEPKQVTQEEEVLKVEEPVVVDEEEKEVEEKQETPSPVIPSIPDSKKLVIADKGRFTNEEIIAKLKKVGLSAAVDQNDNNIVIAIYTHNDGDTTVLNPFVKRVLAAGFKTAIVDNTPIKEN